MPVDAEQREQRQKLIVEILRKRPVLRQEQLVRALRARGVVATQSSISRDLKQLGYVKVGGGYERVTAAAATRDSVDAVLGDFVQSIRAAGPNLIVIVTAVGAAQRVALSLDGSGWPELVGTVSGDDTIFVATRNGADQRRLLARLQARFGGNAGKRPAAGRPAAESAPLRGG